ncbi:mycofactocin biosynthesis peptidyl-dipeptidase MftE [Nocardioides sp.]|uniref:mycofactocin biosynthesis peptidyl-dipeptidase MftE n=1 Tax=Nocardioides sp. TaxID=35761 RepID=UPI0039E5BA39
MADLTWPDLVRGGTVLVPLGSVEQHGPHLPLDTDTVIARAVAEELGALLGADVTPAVGFGASGEHQSFPGTISIGTEALTAVLVELVRSATTWAARVIFVNGHGGNLEAVRRAVSQLRAEGHDVSWVPCATHDADAHAGRTETSLMLHLDPQRVQAARASAGNTAPLTELLPTLRASGVAAVAPNGVLGDPAGASAEEGRDILHAMVRLAHDIVRDVDASPAERSS